MHSTTKAKFIHPNIQTFNMFILIHKTNSLQRLSTRMLILKEDGPQLATSLQRSTQPYASVLINLSASLPPPSWA